MAKLLKYRFALQVLTIFFIINTQNSLGSGPNKRIPIAGDV